MDIFFRKLPFDVPATYEYLPKCENAEMIFRLCFKHLRDIDNSEVFTSIKGYIPLGEEQAVLKKIMDGCD